MSHSQHGHGASRQSSTKTKPRQPRSQPYLSDVKLLPRIRRYMDNKSATDPVDVESILTYLQKTHQDYQRKKRSTFRHSVSRALDILVEELKVSDDEDDVDILASKRPKRDNRKSKGSGDTADDSDDSFSAGEVYADYQDTNAVNSLVTGMYSRQGTSSAAASPAHKPTAAAEQNKKTGFLRCQSEPVFNVDMKDVELDGLGYIDRGEQPSTPLNNSKLIESLPASPRTSHEERAKQESADGDNRNKPSGRKPVIITIGDEEEDHHLESPAESSKGQPTVPKDTQKQSNISSNKKRLLPASKSKSSSAPPPSSNKKTSPAPPPSSNKKTSPAPLPSSNKKGVIDAVYSTTTFSQIGGNETTIEEVQKLLLHMRFPEIYQHIGVTPPRGFLLHGPPGCGKTLIAHAIAGELQLPFFKLAATELVSGVSGESEERVRNLFTKAAASAPCVLFIDEVDAITPKRETASKDMERRIVSQFLTCLDDLCEKKDAHVLVIGATNRPDSLDPALRRAGRFDREICMGIPDTKARESILRVLCKDMQLAEDFDYNDISRLTPGYVGADLHSLIREAAMSAVNRIFVSLDDVVKNQSTNESSAQDVVQSHSETAGAGEDTPKDPLKTVNIEDASQKQTDMEVCESEPDATNTPPAGPSDAQTSVVEAPDSGRGTLSLSHPAAQTSSVKVATGSWWHRMPGIPPEMLKSLHIDMNDFLEAVKVVQPSAKREGFATVPDVTWNDIGALRSIREELQMAILAPIKFPDQFKSLGLNSPSGVLLAGPPGCGKTLLAKAIANESGINFISVKGPELINMYVGESEKAVRQVFQRARNSSPCVVFFDELDSLCPRRSLSGGDGGSGSRVVNQLLTEMDGLQERKQVFIMGATNRPDIIDPAILRPGRLDKTLHVGLPTLEDRVDILRTITKNCTRPHIVGVDLAEIAALPQCEGFSGADLTAVIREASMAAMKEYICGQMASSSSSTGQMASFSSSPTGQSSDEIILTKSHFDVALSNIKPSISIKDRARYQAMATS